MATESEKTPPLDLEAKAAQLRAIMFAEAVERFQGLAGCYGTEQDKGAALFLHDNIPALVADLHRLREREARMRGALIWCGGSADFGPGGKARKGWLKLVVPLLDAPADRGEGEEAGNG